MNRHPGFTSEFLPGLRARNLSRLFGGRKIVDGLDLDIFPGQTVGLLGPNGAGKSTTMQMLTGNIVPSSGKVEICSIDLALEPLAAKRQLGYAPETPPLYLDLTVEEYLRFAARLHRVAKADLAPALNRAIRLCDLGSVKHRSIGALSHGYRQRVGIAQAIVHSPTVLILDEPTVGLDPAQARGIRELIRELGRDHSVLLSTHIMREAEVLCDQMLILYLGKTVFRGRKEDLTKLGTSLEDAFLLLTREDSHS